MSDRGTVPASDMLRAQRILRKAMHTIAEFPSVGKDPFIFISVVNLCLSATYTELFSAIAVWTPESVEQYAGVASSIFRDMLRHNLTERMRHENKETARHARAIATKLRGLNRGMVTRDRFAKNAGAAAALEELADWIEGPEESPGPVPDAPAPRGPDAPTALSGAVAVLERPQAHERIAGLGGVETAASILRAALGKDITP